MFFAAAASGFAPDGFDSAGSVDVATRGVEVDASGADVGFTAAGAGVEVVAGAATGGIDTGCAFGASAPAADGATEGAGMPMSVVLPDGERDGMLEAPGGLDVSGRGGDDATGRGASELGADRVGLDGRGGFDDGARGGLELDAGRGGVVTVLVGAALGLPAAIGADGGGVLLARSGGVALGRAGGALLGRSRAVMLGRGGGVVLATGAGSSPQASSTSSSFSLIPWRL